MTESTEDMQNMKTLYTNCTLNRENICANINGGKILLQKMAQYLLFDVIFAD